MPYGRNNFFPVRRYCCRLLLWLACCSLSQVAFAEFDSTDSFNLSKILHVVNTINTGENFYSVNGEGYTIYDIDYDILTQIREYIYPAVSSIDTSVESILNVLRSSDDTQERSLSKLSSIDSSISSLAAYVTNNLVLAISNAFASVPQCYAVATNQFNVDLSMVTNFWLSSDEQLAYFSSHYLFGTSEFPLYDALLNYLVWGETGSLSIEDYNWLFSLSNLGLQSALLCSALNASFPSDSFDNPLVAAYKSWFDPDSSYMGTEPATFASFEYSIFDAYNTIGLSNLLSQTYSYLTDDDEGLSSISTAISSLIVTNNNYYSQVLSNFFNVVAAAEVIISNQTSSESSSVLAQAETNNYTVTDFYTPLDDFWTDINSDITTDSGSFYSLYNAASYGVGQLHFNDLVDSQQRHNYQVTVGGFRLSDLNGGISVPTIRYEIALADLLDTDLSSILPAIHAFFALFCFFLGVLFFVGQVRSFYSFLLTGTESAILHQRS